MLYNLLHSNNNLQLFIEYNSGRWILERKMFFISSALKSVCTMNLL